LSLESKLLEIQKNLPTVAKTATNPAFRSQYVPLETVLAEVLPVLNAAGILVVQAPDVVNGQPALRTTLIDTTDSRAEDLNPAYTWHPEITHVVPLVLDKQTPQAVGSAITYMRRYSLMSILGLVGEPDTDGEAAMSRSGGSVSRSKGTRAPSAGSTTTHEF